MCALAMLSLATGWKEPDRVVAVDKQKLSPETDMFFGFRLPSQ
jgi:hypothetical protein